MRVAPAVELSPEERATLQRWARSRAKLGLRATRARMILAAAEGKQDLEIARTLGVHRMTVARWRRRFRSSRIRRLEVGALAAVRFGRIADDRVREIVRAASIRSPVGNRPWTTRTLGRSLGVSHSTVRRVWNAYGVRPERFVARPPRADPKAPLVPVDIVGVYLRPPLYVIVFSTRPGPAPTIEERPGTLAARTRSGAVDLFASTFPSTRPALDPFAERDCARFLGETLHRVGPSAKAVALVTGALLESGHPLDRWAVRHPELRMEILRDVDHWRERAATEFRRIAQHPFSREFGGRGELVRAIRLYLVSYRPSAGPFEWIASSADVRSTVAGYRLRYELSGTGHTGFKRGPSVPGPMKTATTSDARLREMARAILRRSLKVQRGERVTILTWSGTAEAANALVLESLRLGARPLLLYQDEPTYWAATKEVAPSHLAHVGDHARAALGRSDVFVSFFGPSDRERFHALPWAVRNRLGEFQDDLFSAAARARTRAVQLAMGRVSEASARMYGADAERWKNELIDATLVDPLKLHARATRVAEALQHGGQVRIRHSNGTDLRLGLRGRTPQISDGQVPRARRGGRWDLVQLPAGVVTTALDERIAEGTFVSNVRNSVAAMDTVGEASGGRWVFSQGRLLRFSYAEGQELFSQSYARGPAGKERPGALSIGLNEAIDIAPLLLDQAYGAVTFQIGRNDVAGGTTKVPWWAWLILRGADMTVDGKYLLRNGRLVG